MLLENCTVLKKHTTVRRLASVPRRSETVESRLLGRGVSPESLQSILPFLGDKLTFSIEDIVDRSFEPRKTTDTPYSIGRFGDGTIGVYYSALDENTCKAELEYHLNAEVSDLGNDLNRRYYTLIECNYDGSTVDLRGMEANHCELVSQSKSGYPFCQALGRQAVERKLDGFLTVSARNLEGTCVPVFSRKAVSNPRLGRSYCATISVSVVDFEELQESH